MTYTALLRGINVGGHRVTMERLRELFEALGFGSVETFIASGNVIFTTNESDTATLEAQIETHLKQALGYEVATFLRTPEQLAMVSAACPFTPSDTDSLYITFLKAPADTALQERLQALPTQTDTFAFANRELYRLVRGKLTASDIPDATLNRAQKGWAGTARNITTVRKLAEKYAKP
jgi:uncharacterized protein (DUF1697 family)